MTIRKVILREINLPLQSPFVTSHGTITHRRSLIIELMDGDGYTGWGECSALEQPGYLPETLDTSLSALQNWLIPALLKHDFFHPNEIQPYFDKSIRGWNFAKATLEMAVWDLFARQKEIALAQILGGVQQKVAAGIVLGIEDDLHRLIEKAQEAVTKGYKRLKIKIAPGNDYAALQALRRKLGVNFDIAADANSAYTRADLEHLLRFDDLQLSMMEQPFGWDDHFDHAELQKMLQTPICLDESILSFADCQTMHAMQSGRIVNLKPGRVGGLTTSLKIHEFCLKRNIPLWCGGMLESGIGRAFNIALASLPGFTLPGDLSPSARYFERDIVLPEWQMDAQGFVAVPFDRPGIGIEVDRDYLTFVTVGEWQFQ
ncbi:MAG: o-succinylbenzoate synthase [Deferribacteres bacterium]|nr:o-succinylbenzoate synthase [candidate division KSB1 bacterium]MCB9501846.1 o-succinylbenzoate synthase [Deferribacteres bacterium]